MFIVKWKCIHNIPALKNMSPHDLYLWSRNALTADHIRDLSVFKSSKYVVQHADIAFGRHIDPSPIPIINKIDACSWITEQVEKHNIRYIYSPREIEYRDSKDRIVYIYADPFHPENGVNENFVNYQGDRRLIYSLISHDHTQVGGNDILYLTTSTEVTKAYEKKDTKNRIYNGIILPYFPYKSDKDEIVNKKKSDTIKNTNEIIANVIEYPDSNLNEHILENKYRVQRLTIELDWINVGSLTNYLQSAFNQMDTTSVLPFMEFKNSKDNMFKINKQNISMHNQHEIQWDDLEKWVLPRKHNGLTCRLFFEKVEGINKFFTVVFSENGLAQIFYRFHQSTDISLQKVIQSFEEVNRMFERMETIWAMPNAFPRLSSSVFAIDKPSTIRITDFEASMVVNLNKAVCPIQHAKSYLQTLYPFLESVVLNNANLKMKYKRVQNYRNSEMIDDFIRKYMSQLTPEQLKTALHQQFFLDDDEITLILEDIDNRKDNNEKLKLYQRIKKDVILTADILTNTSFRVKLTGKFLNIPILERVMKIMCMAWLDVSEHDIRKNDKLQDEWKSIMDDKLSISSVDVNELEDEYGDTDARDMEDDNDLDIDFGNWDTDTMKKDIDNEMDDDLEELEEEKADDANDMENERDDDENEEEAKSNNKSKKTDTIDPQDDVKYRKQILKRLQEFDKDLFAHRWTSVCGAENRRQPVALTKAEKDYIDANFPGSYTNFVNAGTTEERKKANYYVCPKIWCPQSKVTMTKQQLEDHGNKCPPPFSEKPIRLDDGNYWNKNGKEADHYVALTNKYKHPKGILQPCCFKREGGDDEDTTNIRYILRPDVIPVDVNRYGALPDSLGEYFESSLSSGHLIENKKVYTRMGVDQGPDSFFQCMVHLLDNPDIQTVADMKQRIRHYLSVFEFIKLNNGNLVKVFFNQDESLEMSSNFSEFKKWFTDDKRSAYVTMFHLRPVIQWLDDNDHFVFEGYDDMTIAVLREYMIFNSYRNFIRYIESDIPKDADMFFDLFNRMYPWLNYRGYNLVLFNAEDMVYLACPKYVPSKYVLDLTRPFIMLLKQNQIYEPIVLVNYHKGSIQITKNMSYFGNPHIRNIGSYFENNCTSSQLNDPWIIARKVVNALEVRGHAVREIVIDMSFKLRGVILVSKLFIPLEKPSIIPEMRHRYARYIDQIHMLEPTITLKEIEKILDDLANDTSEPYYTSYKPVVKAVKGKEDLVLALSFGDAIIPIQLGERYAHYAIPDDTTVFIQSSTEMFPEDRSLLIYPEVLARICRKILLSKEASSELRLLKHSENPLPWEMRLDQLAEMLPLWAPEVQDSEHMHLFIQDIMLKDPVQLLNESMDKMKFKDSELLLNRHDLLRNRLRDIYERLRNPFRFVENSIEDYVEYGIFQLVDPDVVKPPVFTLSTPIYPERWNRALKNRFILRSTDSENDNLLEVFLYISKLLRRGITRSQMKHHLMNLKKKAFEINPVQAIEMLMGNSSFRAKTKRFAEKLPTQSWESIRDNYLLDNSYVYGESDVYQLASLVQVNVVLISRQNPKRFESGFRLAITDHSNLYTLLHIEHGENADMIRPVCRKVDDHLIFDISELPREFVSEVHSTEFLA